MHLLQCLYSSYFSSIGLVVCCAANRSVMTCAWLIVAKQEMFPILADVLVPLFKKRIQLLTSTVDPQLVHELFVLPAPPVHYFG